MTYFADLAPCTYFGSALVTSEPPLAVGWLDNVWPYPRGRIGEAYFVKLMQLAVMPWQPVGAMGWHDCELCAFTRGTRDIAFRGRTARLGISNLFIPSATTLYIAPSLILHYIDAHEYAPPPEFLDAIAACPPMSSPEYVRMLAALGVHV